jgi:hypothetical protein
MRGFALVYSNLGPPNGQEIMQKRQPMHFSSRHTTGPSGVLRMAAVRQAEAQAGETQCMHWRFTKTSPFEVWKRPIAVHCFSFGLVTVLGSAGAS